MQPNFGKEEADACYDYMKSGGWVTEFKKTQELEKMICEYTGAKHCHMVNNGTISLSLALLAVGVDVGNKVIVPNMTMIASPNSIGLIGARVKFVDVDKDTMCMDIDAVENVLRKDKTVKAVMHVSLNTRCNDIIRLKEICNKYNVALIEDSAQSLGSFYEGKHLGTFGDIGSFSFSSPKIISTGQGGCLVTDSDELSNKIYKLKNFGRASGGIDLHDCFGINCKFTDLQAVVGIEQMKKLPWRVTRMKEIWHLYYNRLHDVSGIEMVASKRDSWIPWFIDIYVDNPKKLLQFLKTQNVGSRLVYPKITSQPMYATEEYTQVEYPNTEYWSTRGLWLPSSTVLTDKNINDICDIIIKYYSDNK